ncbi:MAG: hydantoinase B/oxoprolinase family protein [gamma proteobacterium symbiont of Bathyaustriella thionipta]|nr:hydantoinase B/oxoprolinase family protein [gamma proteobacterium symbiont of Bathyaustriella thionipta]
MNPIELSIFVSRIESICEEMGAVLRRSAFSPNIKDRLDYSCAVFDGNGELCAQAAHIPVHLGSMAYAMADIVKTQSWHNGDMLVLNNPYLGGTHLPDVTMIAPVFSNDNKKNENKPVAFVVNRAHHADIGADSPGSMPMSHSLHEEGLIISPTFIMHNEQVDDSILLNITSNMSKPDSAKGDFLAQISANQNGVMRLNELITQLGVNHFTAALLHLNDYGERVARSALAAIPSGIYRFHDFMDDDGAGQKDIKIKVLIHIDEQGIKVDFSGTEQQVKGNINCPLSVAAAAFYYVFRCLMPAQTPACAGTFRMIELLAPEGCLLNARYPAAVAAGNVETSTRVVDVVLGALAQPENTLHKNKRNSLTEKIPSASYGTMNNIAMGSREINNHWDYYETIGGGHGASQAFPGLSGAQAHMTNTLNTPIESLEHHYPLRVTRYSLRGASGGHGLNSGGMGLIREVEFLQATQVTLLTERRRYSPWGLAGGENGQIGENYLDGELLAGKVYFTAQAGQKLTIKTPGGGWGKQ